jgi:hypothetical protein
VGRAGTASAVPWSAGFFSELLLHDDPAKPGHVIEDQLTAVAFRVAEASATSPGSARLPVTRRGGVVPAGPGRHTAAGSHSYSGCSGLANGRNAAEIAGQPTRPPCPRPSDIAPCRARAGDPQPAWFVVLPG